MSSKSNLEYEDICSNAPMEKNNNNKQKIEIQNKYNKLQNKENRNTKEPKTQTLLPRKFYKNSRP
jgi:DNA recombination-dependent growth factor C